LAGRLFALRAAAFFFAGLRAAPFFAGRFAVFGALLRAAFFAGFFAGLFAAFFAGFFATFRALFAAAFFGDFVAAFIPDPPARAPALDPLPLRPEPGAARSGVLGGIVNAGGEAGGGNGSLMGVSSIHPPLVQPVSISSNPDIGAPCSQRGVTRRRYWPPGPS
jgi:hypothetical protein